MVMIRGGTTHELRDAQPRRADKDGRLGEASEAQGRGDEEQRGGEQHEDGLLEDEGEVEAVAAAGGDGRAKGGVGRGRAERRGGVHGGQFELLVCDSASFGERKKGTDRGRGCRWGRRGVLKAERGRGAAAGEIQGLARRAMLLSPSRAGFRIFCLPALSRGKFAETT